MAKAHHTTKDDATLLKLGARLNEQIDLGYSHYKKSRVLKRGLERKLKKAPKVWEARNALWQTFEWSRAGKAHLAEWEIFNGACKEAHKTSRTILRKKPRTIAGAAVYAIAAVFEGGEWGGFGSPIHGSAWWTLRAFSEAGGVPLPKGMKQALYP